MSSGLGLTDHKLYKCLKQDPHTLKRYVAFCNQELSVTAARLEQH